uniref:Secreted protein n=1 Tax=Ciona intestinalis TaxID=7719 RepID=F6VC32_CIOIN
MNKSALLLLLVVGPLVLIGTTNATIVFPSRRYGSLWSSFRRRIIRIHPQPVWFYTPLKTASDGIDLSAFLE